MSFRTQIERGSRVLVKRNGRVTEATVVDAFRDCVKVRFRWLCFWWHEWLPIKSDVVRIELPNQQ